MNVLRRFFGNSDAFISLNVLHALNDGFDANYLLILPFIAKDLHISLFEVGILGTLLYIFSILLAVPSGYIATKIGGFKTILFALFIYSIGFVGIGFANNYMYLLLMFVLGGIGLALFHPIGLALIARWASKETRGSTMGNFAAFGDLGKISLSTLLAFIIGYIGWKDTAFLYGACAFLIGVIFYVFFLKRADTFTKKGQNPIQVSMVEILKDKPFLYAVLTNAVDNFASQTLFIFLPFLLLQRGFSPSIIGVFAGAFFIGNFTGRILLGKFVDRYNTTKVFIVSEILMAFFIFLLANTTLLYLIIIFSVILGIFTKGTTPIVKTMVSESVEHHGNYEKAYGITSTISNSSNALSSIAFGYISTQLGIISAFNIMAVIAILAVFPALGFYFTKKKIA